jgi:CoB--CoM heterodisulfide reductase subunit B
MKEFAIFWGCTIPARFPFLEKSTRLVMDGLGLPYRDVNGFTCCPEKSLVNNVDSGLWKLTAARNVAVVDELGIDLVSPCTGCVSNLATVKKELKSDPGARAEANAVLKAAGREFTGKASLNHLVPFFHDKVGVRKIKDAVKTDFSGMRVAIHYGCHMMRPSHALHNDDPLSPVKFDNIVRALGAESIKYRTKLTCCGQGLDRVNQHDNALKLAREKLRELMALGADALVLCCPSCFLQFDNNQFLMQKEGERLSIPVLYYTDMLGLAMGYTAEELGLDSHRMDVAPFIEKWKSLRSEDGKTGSIVEEMSAQGVFEL